MSKKNKNKCIDCGGSMKKEPLKAKKCTSCKEKTKTNKKKVEKIIDKEIQQEIEEVTSNEVEKAVALVKPDRIPTAIGRLKKVKVFVCKVGVTKYRYSIQKPIHPVVFEKEMTGLEAVQYLRKVQRMNRFNRLESIFLIKPF